MKNYSVYHVLSQIINLYSKGMVGNVDVGSTVQSRELDS